MFGCADHAITTDPASNDPRGLTNPFIANLREQARHFGLTMLEVGELGHGIMHVISPELGITLPGLTLCCSDSHSCTNGALGALSWGIGAGELTHILATQTSVQRKPKTMRITLDGRLPPGTQGKDIILHLIGEIGVAAGNGYAVEYAGSAIRALADGGPLHGLQHVGRIRRAVRHDLARRHDVRTISPGARTRRRGACGMPRSPTGVRFAVRSDGSLRP